MPAATKTPLQRAKEHQAARAGDAALMYRASVMQDDAWVGGAGWSGPLPRPEPGSAQSAAHVAQVTAELQRGFISRNLGAGLVRRHVFGIAGRDPIITLTAKTPAGKGGKPSDEQAGRAKELRAAFDGWWTNSGAMLAVQRALFTAKWSGSGTVRLFIPRSKLQELPTGQRGVPGGLSLSEALGYVSVHAPDWDQAGVTRDLEGRVTGAYYRYKDEGGAERWEVQTRQGGRTRVEPDARAGVADGAAQPDEFPVPDLLTFQIDLEPLVTRSLESLFKTVNRTLTMGGRNIDLGGFLERTILNAQMPGTYQDVTVGGVTTKKFVPDAYHVGAGVTNFLNGIAVRVRNEATNELEPTGAFANPSVVYRDPVQWTTFGDTLRDLREAIYEEAAQLHVIISGDATASGVSRVQAVQDFIMSLEPTRTRLEQLARWLVMTVLGIGLYLTGDTEAAELRDWVPGAQARASAVQPTPAEVQAATTLREKRLISLKRFYALIGIEEPEQETADLAAEPITQDVALVLLDRAPAWVGLRALMLAFPALGITSEQIEAHYQMDTAGGGPPVGIAALAEEKPGGSVE